MLTMEDMLAIVKPHNDTLIAEGRLATALAELDLARRRLATSEELRTGLVKELRRLRQERDELYGYVKGLLGLTQLIRGRDDMSPGIAEVLRTNHRATNAAAYLTQIVPPSAQ